MKILTILLILIVLILSAFVGKVDIHLSALLDPNSIDSTIFYQLRLPRVLLGFLAGGILALSGLIFQTLFRNPLTTPFTLGISSGATLGAATAIIFGYHSSFLGFSSISLFALSVHFLRLDLSIIFQNNSAPLRIIALSL